MQDKNDGQDHDLIPDVLQKRSEPPPPEAVEHEFGQMAERPAGAQPAKEKKPGVLGRLFGGSKKTESWHKHHEGPSSQRKPDEWALIDFRSGTYRDPHLYKQNRAAVERHMREDTRGILPKFSVRNEFAKRMAAKKGKGWTKTEARDVISEMRKEKKMTESQSRHLKSKYKAWK